jgi:ATP-binding cassette, subfamily B, bacterial
MDKQIITREAVHQVLRDYWHQYKIHPWFSAIAFLMPAIGTIFVFFIPPLILAKLVNIFIAQGVISLTSVGKYIALLGGLWLLGEIFWRIGIHFLTKIEAEGMNNLCKTAFSRLVARDYNFYANHFVGSLSKKAFAFSRSFESFSDTLLFNVTTNIIPIAFAIIILWTYSPWIPLILIFWIALAIGIAYPIIRRRSKLVALRHDAGSKMVGRLSDSITNMLAIKSFANENWESVSYGEYADDYSKKYKRAADYQNLKFDAIISPIYVMTNVTGLIAAVFFAERLGLQAGVIVVVFSYYSLITRIFWEISKVYRSIESSISEAAEFTQILIELPAVQDMPSARHLKVVNPSIQFKKVNFRYDDDTQDENNLFLNNFNLEIKSNQKVGLVGSSGGGKTTIAKLLLRFIDLQSGEITIDNQNISEVTQSSLREAIAYVPQEPLLFHRSLFENISYGNEIATKEDVVAAAKLAHADEFITQLTKGYQTLVGERGIKLSGGQRQRIAIARAILKKSPILLLDEATSSLDSESEKYIQEGLWELMKNKTALVIAHRLSTIKHLDRIIVLSQGKIVQDGTHNELIKQKGLYAKLWSHQSGKFLED